MFKLFRKYSEEIFYIQGGVFIYTLMYLVFSYVNYMQDTSLPRGLIFFFVGGGVLQLLCIIYVVLTFKWLYTLLLITKERRDGLSTEKAVEGVLPNSRSYKFITNLFVFLFFWIPFLAILGSLVP